MFSVWIKTGGVVLIIVIGYIMKKTGTLQESAAKVLAKVMMKVTLPCVFICNLNGLTITGDMSAALLFGFAVQFVLVAAAVLLSLRKPADRVYIMHYCMPGFNISSVAMPVAQIFTTAYAVSSLVMININVALYFYLVTPVLVQIMARGEKKIDVKGVARSFLDNTPAVVSVVMLLLCLLHIALPEELITVIRPMANANATVALLSIGLLFEFPKKLPRDNIIALSARLLIAGAAALLVRFGIIPFGEVREAMIIAMFAPLPSSAPAMALHFGYKGSEVAFGASATLIVSIILMSIVCALLF